jgi:curved DNA-binding protein CbpA
MIQTRLSPEEARAVLGLASAAGRDEIARAFRAAAKRLHPDAGGEAGAFGRAVEAYRRLIPHRGVDESATRQRRRRFAEAWTAQAL